MGIEIHLDMIPARVSSEDWQKVYSDSLTLLSKYPFMDKYSGCRANGLEYIYGAHSRERNDLYGCYRGWRSVGDLYTGYNTEEFSMKADIADYRQGRDDDGGDVLASLIYHNKDFPELRIPKGDNIASVFYAKTQGEDSHLYLLAIACMVATAFQTQPWSLGILMPDSAALQSNGRTNIYRIRSMSRYNVMPGVSLRKYLQWTVRQG